MRHDCIGGSLRASGPLRPSPMRPDTTSPSFRTPTKYTLLCSLKCCFPDGIHFRSALWVWPHMFGLTGWPSNIWPCMLGTTWHPSMLPHMVAHTWLAPQDSLSWPPEDSCSFRTEANLPPKLGLKGRSHCSCRGMREHTNKILLESDPCLAWSFLRLSFTYLPLLSHMHRVRDLVRILRESIWL